MEQTLSHRRERGSWAPFVGVALAALTAGSLVLFSVVAQRTSLEGFSARGVAVAPVPPRETTGSITLPDASEASTSDRGADETGADETAEPDAAELLFVTDDEPTAMTTAAAQGEPGAPLEGGAPIAQDGDTQVAAAADANDLTPFFRMAGGAPDNGEVEADTDAKKAKGSDGDKKDKKNKNEKVKKDKKSKESKKSKNASRRSGSRGRSAHGDRGRSSRSASASSRRSSNAAASSRSARPSRSSRPAQASRSSAPKPRPSSNHQNQRGNGHSKGRGKGHRH